MTTQYLYPDHTDPGQYINRVTVLVPRELYPEMAAELGLAAHVTEDGEAPLGHGVWEVQPDGSFMRLRLGTDEERAAASLTQARAAMEVTALQGMLAIQQLGELAVAGFNAWKASLDPISDFAAVSFFEKAPTWKRDNPYLIAGATALGLDDEQLDGLFALAATL